ncbi:hypothetical protein PSECIP111951_01962 [Pseudoalteromonas holothuriae]|uniref:Amidohydrolase-related domain-containing protein n=1 Tax=Pseudoalteromonas holothuriae TaxID=2963714 RepID=A0ABN8UL20_9GAMM|nr:amidohydrolase family protein [Pseudoalteromonas sp. CIP111951]CAH9058887.1 hypothetical protein PSECIP111951_01962 [Pseudoalteromonas sp. CIP111951]
MTPIIDPHLHFFDLAQGQYQWLRGSTPPPWPNLEKIIRDHSLIDLQLDSEFYLAGLVHIEAGFNNTRPDAELYWLAEHIKTLPYQAIAYLDIAQDPTAFSMQLNLLKNAPGFIGIRDITEGHEAQKLLHPNTAINLSRLAELNIIFEAQFELEQTDVTKQFSALCAQLNTLQVIINHSGFLRQNTNWQAGLHQMATCSNVAIKYSGQEHVTKPLSNTAQLAFLLDAFGPERVMFASNYPVCLIRADYAKVWRQYYQLVDDTKLWERLSFTNAKRIYRL